MTTETSIESVVQHYLDGVATALAGSPAQQRDTLIRELRQHIGDSIDDRITGRTATVQDAYAVLSELDSPDTYSGASPAAAVKPKPDKRLVVFSLLCSALQPIGLIAIVAGVRVVPAVAGFAAIANFFVVWSSSRTLPRTSAIAAICGLFLIAFEISRSL